MPGKSNDILVLDDEKGYAEMLCSMLGEAGFSTVMFTDPDEAFAWLGKHRCALILADYSMPRLNGSEFLQKVREANQLLPLIMISGQMNTRELINVANLGVSLVMEKPIERNTLLENVRIYIKPHQTAAHTVEPAKSKKAPRNSNALPSTKAIESFTYPAEGLRCSQSGEASRAMIQSIWNALQEHNAVVLSLPLGSELELIVADIEHWYHLKAPATRLSPLMIPESGIEGGKEDALFILDARYSSGDLRNTISSIREQLPPKTPILILQRSDNARPSGDIPLVIVPPLAGRVRDIAFYSCCILERVGATNFLTPDAARVLLDYEWSGNYYELMGALRRAVIAQNNELIDAEALSEAIASGHGAASKDSAEKTLADFLAEEQAAWFEERGCRDIQTAAEQAGIPESRFDKGKPVSRQPLLFPDLV